MNKKFFIKTLCVFMAIMLLSFSVFICYIRNNSAILSQSNFKNSITIASILYFVWSILVIVIFIAFIFLKTQKSYQTENKTDDFLSDVAHELRTPLTSICGFIDSILCGAIKEEKQSYYLDVVSKESHRLSRLINSLLDISRINSGKRTFSFETFDICETIRLIIISFEEQLNNKNLSVNFEPAYDTCSVCADKDAIYEVIYNLFDNAIKYSLPSEEIKISINKIKNKFEISVLNFGESFNDAEKINLFKKFFRSDSAITSASPGVGIGLYICKSIIDAHGETITVDSEEGKYCKFSFTVKSTEQEK